MPIADYLRPIVNWFAHHIARGASALGLIPGAGIRYPDLPTGSLEVAAELGRQAVENAAAIQTLAPDQPLSDALRGREPIEESVTVRTLVGLRDAAGQLDDMLFRVTVPWAATLQDLIHLLEVGIKDRLDRSPGLLVVGVNIVPPLLLADPDADAAAILSQIR
jgi:hypothetical protein